MLVVPDEIAHRYGKPFSRGKGINPKLIFKARDNNRKTQGIEA
jgi:hypothetical protein